MFFQNGFRVTKKAFLFTFPVIFFLLAVNPPLKAQANVIYVKSGASGDGSSWDLAYGDLKSASEKAQTGTQIWVASGKYFTTSDRCKSFTIPDGVKLYGGFSPLPSEALKWTTENGVTTLSVDLESKWRYELGIEEGEPIITKLVFPEGFVIANKSEIEKETGLYSEGDNEVIIRIQIPGADLTVSKQGTLSFSTNVYFTLFILIFFLAKWRWLHLEGVKTLLFKPRNQKQCATIKQLLADGKLRKALESLFTLMGNIDEELQQDVFLLSSRFSNLTRNRNLRLITEEEYNIERNNITFSTLDLIRQIRSNSQNLV